MKIKLAILVAFISALSFCATAGSYWSPPPSYLGTGPGIYRVDPSGEVKGGDGASIGHVGTPEDADEVGKVIIETETGGAIICVPALGCLEEELGIEGVWIPIVLFAEHEESPGGYDDGSGGTAWDDTSCNDYEYVGSC